MQIIWQFCKDAYQDYLIVGGMPQAVLNYLENGRNAAALDPLIHHNLMLAYLADMTKYVTSPAEGVKITEVYQSIPRQLAKENHLSDVGLLSSMCGIRMRDLMTDVHNIYKGAVTENYVVQQLAAKDRELFYFKPSESMEIDLVIDDGREIVPVEIKSGRHKRSKSLVNYSEKYHPVYSIRISERNFGFENGIFSVPLYAVWCIK